MKRLILILLFTLSIVPAFGAERKSPIVIESQKLAYDKANFTATYIGSVIAQRGSTIMKADKLIIHFDKTSRYVEEMEFINNVSMIDPRGKGWCDKLFYYPAEGKAVLEGNARLTRGLNSIIGDRIVAYKNGKVDVEGIKQKVKTVIYANSTENNFRP